MQSHCNTRRFVLTVRPDLKRLALRKSFFLTREGSALLKYETESARIWLKYAGWRILSRLRLVDTRRFVLTVRCKLW